MEEKINDSKITADEKISINDIKPDKSLRILTGIRPTGHLHIGHYFGAAKSWVELQDKFEADVAKFEKDGPKWNANVADHAATSVKGPQPDNWMPSPDTSHSGFTYDNRFIGGFGGNGQNGNGTPPPPGGPHHTR